MADGQPSRRPGAVDAGRRGTRCATAGVHGSAGHAVPVPAAVRRAVRHLRAGARRASGSGSACTTGTSCCRNKPFVGLQNYTALFDPASVQFEPFWHEHAGHRRSSRWPASRSWWSSRSAWPSLLNRTFPGRTFFRAVFFAPVRARRGGDRPDVALPARPDFGAGQRPASACSGCPRDIPWITDQPWAWISLVAVTVWWTLGFNAVIYLAGLQDIPRDQYEAAALDGAAPGSSSATSPCPGLRPVLVFMITITSWPARTCSASPT